VTKVDEMVLALMWLTPESESSRVEVTRLGRAGMMA
jgi:hypothetical protein